MYEVIGVKRVEFTGSDGKAVKGYNLFCTYPDEKTTGVACDRFFVLDDKLPIVPAPGERIEVRWNKFGKIQVVEVL